MKYTIKFTQLEGTPAIRSYMDKKIADLDRMMDSEDSSVRAEVEIGKLGKHHKSGDIFFAEINLHAMKKRWRAVEESDTLYKAIDAVKDAIIREVTSAEKKARVKNRKDARRVKERLRK